MIVDLKEVRVGEYRRALFLIFGAVALLLLIAVANVAGLVLVQLRRRAIDFAIRSAIGAPPRQVVMVVMREVAILAILGGVGGALIAIWLTSAIASGFTIPRISEVTVDRRALIFAAATSTLAAVAFGLMPAVYTTRRRLASLLSSACRGVVCGRDCPQGALVV